MSWCSCDSLSESLKVHSHMPWGSLATDTPLGAIKGAGAPIVNKRFFPVSTCVVDVLDRWAPAPLHPAWQRRHEHRSQVRVQVIHSLFYSEDEGRGIWCLSACFDGANCSKSAPSSELALVYLRLSRNLTLQGKRLCSLLFLPSLTFWKQK